MVKLRTTRKAYQKRWRNCRSSDRSLIIRSDSSMSKWNEKSNERRRYSANNKNTGDYKLSRGMSRMQKNVRVKSSKIHPHSGPLNRKPEPLKRDERHRKIMKKSNRL